MRLNKPLMTAALLSILPTFAAADALFVIHREGGVAGAFDPGRSREIRIWISGSDIRQDIGRTSVFMKGDGGRLVVLRHDLKAYAEMELRKPAGEAARSSEQGGAGDSLEGIVTPTQEKRTIRGRNAQRYILEVRSSDGMNVQESDVWIARDFPVDLAPYRTLMQALEPIDVVQGTLARAMTENAGFPVLMENRTSFLGGVVESKQELVSVEQTSAPAGTFEIPGNYRKDEQASLWKEQPAPPPAKKVEDLSPKLLPGGPVISVSAGRGTSFALKQDGSLWGWGRNEKGELGDGTKSSRPRPSAISPGTTWRAVSAGDECTAALSMDGTLWAWGNWDPNLGSREKPFPVQISPESGWTAVAAGGNMAFALKADGSLWSYAVWLTGLAEPGIIDPKRENPGPPQRIGDDSDWASVSYGVGHGTPMAIKRDGSLWQLSVSDGAAGGGPKRLHWTAQPVGTDRDWETAVSGAGFVLAIKKDGSLWSWGRNGKGQLGDGTNADRTSPAKVGQDRDWAQASAGNDFAVATKRDGSLWTWGGNEKGQLGDGTTTNRLTPTRIRGDVRWASADAGADHVLALSSDGKAFAWGNKRDGQVSVQPLEDAPAPTRIGEARDWAATASGWKDSVAVKKDGSLWRWGGARKVERVLAPTRVGTANSWVAVATGESCRYALTADGALWGWGQNYAGWLGDGTEQERPDPVPIGAEFHWKSVATSGGHSAAVREDGTLWVWGQTRTRDFGYDEKNFVRPTQVGNDQDWAAVAAGGDQTLALKTDGSLWWWGDYGDCGNPKSRCSSKPIRVAGVGPWAAFGVGRAHALAIRDDGTLWAWGRGDRGQLGLGASGSMGIKKDPVQVGSDRDWATVASGQGFSIAMKRDGTLWAWGDVPRIKGTPVIHVPTQVGSDSDWMAASAGLDHALLLKRDGSIWGWGTNDSAQLGFDPEFDAMSPIPVGGL